MTKTIAITGATDGIGLATAVRLAELGHELVVHGRSEAKLEAAVAAIRAAAPTAVVAAVRADLSDLAETRALADDLAGRSLDVLINNAGVFKVAETRMADGLDVRMQVNVVAPFLINRLVEPTMPPDGRIVNLSSAAQAPVDPEVLRGTRAADHMEAYAQSKLALTMISMALGLARPEGPMVVAVNPGSLLATRMVNEGFGVAGSDIGIGVGILVAAAVGDEFADAHGTYFDNDARRFAPPHPDALDPAIRALVVAEVAALADR